VFLLGCETIKALEIENADDISLGIVGGIFGTLWVGLLAILYYINRKGDEKSGKKKGKK
jgi:hypothetical protein